MRHFSLFILLGLLLTTVLNGCSPKIISTPVTPTATALSTQTAIDTATATVTATAVPTETPLPVWALEYTAKLTDTREITVRDVLPDAKGEFSYTKLFNLELITDESFSCESGRGGKYRFVGYNAFSTSEGGAGYHSDEAYQAVAKVIMWAFFESAVRAGYESQQVVSAENKYDAFTQFVREMIEEKQVEIRAILPVATQEYKLQTETLGLPETIRVIFVSANNYRFKNLPRNDQGNIAWGMHIASEDNILELYIGGDKNLFYVHSYNLSNRYAFATWQAFGLNGNQAPYDLISKGNQYAAKSNSDLTGALDCKP